MIGTEVEQAVLRSIMGYKTKNRRSHCLPFFDFENQVMSMTKTSKQRARRGGYGLAIVVNSVHPPVKLSPRSIVNISCFLINCSYLSNMLLQFLINMTCIKPEQISIIA